MSISPPSLLVPTLPPFLLIRTETRNSASRETPANLAAASREKDSRIPLVEQFPPPPYSSERIRAGSRALAFCLFARKMPRCFATVSFTPPPLSAAEQLALWSFNGNDVEIQDESRAPEESRSAPRSLGLVLPHAAKFRDERPRLRVPRWNGNGSEGDCRSNTFERCNICVCYLKNGRRELLPVTWERSTRSAREIGIGNRARARNRSE